MGKQDVSQIATATNGTSDLVDDEFIGVQFKLDLERWDGNKAWANKLAQKQVSELLSEAHKRRQNLTDDDRSPSNRDIDSWDEESVWDQVGDAIREQYEQMLDGTGEEDDGNTVRFWPFRDVDFDIEFQPEPASDAVARPTVRLHDVLPNDIKQPFDIVADAERRMLGITKHTTKVHQIPWKGMGVAFCVHTIDPDSHRPHPFWGSRVTIANKEVQKFVIKLPTEDASLLRGGWAGNLCVHEITGKA